MRSPTQPFIIYIVTVFLVLIGMGTIFIQLTTEWVIVLFTLLGSAIIFCVLMYNVYDKYIKPIRSAAKVADELIKGNYKARTYESFYGEAGNLSHSINVLARSLQEITLQEQMQDNQLKTVVNNMESGLMLIDEKGYVHLVNRKFLNTFSGNTKSYVGYLYYNVLEQAKIHHTVQEVFLYEEKVKSSFTLLFKKEQKYIEVVGAPIFNERKVLKGSVLVFHDITELKRLEQMRKDFVANVSHELKTPITSIKGFAETLLDGAMYDEELRQQFMTIILDESERLESLTYDLLELSKLEKDELQLQNDKISISSVVEDVLPLIKQTADSRNILLTTTLSGSGEMIGDFNRLKQVFINLLNNAISYTSSNGEITLYVKDAGDRIIFCVSDTGIGISEEAKPRIFERFYRVDKARSRNTGGTGLGLAIVKHIVEAHKGSIQVDSELGTGTTFRIELPKNKNNILESDN